MGSPRSVLPCPSDPSSGVGGSVGLCPCVVCHRVRGRLSSRAGGKACESSWDRGRRPPVFLGVGWAVVGSRLRSAAAQAQGRHVGLCLCRWRCEGEPLWECTRSPRRRTARCRVACRVACRVSLSHRRLKIQLYKGTREKPKTVISSSRTGERKDRVFSKPRS